MKKHWYSSLPSFLIGAALIGVTDPNVGTPANKDITAELHLTRGMRVVNAFTVDSAREEWHTHPAATRPPGVYYPPSKTGDPPDYFPNNTASDKSSASGFFAVELKLADKATFKAAYPGATDANENYLNYDTTKKKALWEHSGYFWPTSKYYDASGTTPKGWIESDAGLDFKVHRRQ